MSVVEVSVVQESDPVDTPDRTAGGERLHTTPASQRAREPMHARGRMQARVGARGFGQCAFRLTGGGVSLFRVAQLGYHRHGPAQQFSELHGASVPRARAYPSGPGGPFVMASGDSSVHGAKLEASDVSVMNGSAYGDVRAHTVPLPSPMHAPVMQVGSRWGLPRTPCARRFSSQGRPRRRACFMHPRSSCIHDRARVSDSGLTPRSLLRAHLDRARARVTAALRFLPPAAHVPAATAAAQLPAPHGACRPRTPSRTHRRRRPASV